MDQTDKKIVKALAKGLTQQEVSEEFKLSGYTPNSLSIIEKRLKALKKEYRAKTIFKLALILRSKKII